jgi:hypothetical protein
MRSTPPKMSQPGPGFNGTVGCDPSVPARGIPTRTYREIMREYSSSRISRGLNVEFGDARKKRVVQYQSVHRVLACKDPDIPSLCQAGTRVTVYLKDVPREASERSAGRPFVVFSLLQHEHKKSVVHFSIQRNTEYEDSVRAKVCHHFPHLSYGGG